MSCQQKIEHLQSSGIYPIKSGSYAAYFSEAKGRNVKQV